MKNSIADHKNARHPTTPTAITEEKGLSQPKLADALGVNQTTISQWLLGIKKPSYDSIMLIYEKFGVTPNSLFGTE